MYIRILMLRSVLVSSIQPRNGLLLASVCPVILSPRPLTWAGRTSGHCYTALGCTVGLPVRGPVCALALPTRAKLEQGVVVLPGWTKGRTSWALAGWSLVSPLGKRGAWGRLEILCPSRGQTLHLAALRDSPACGRVPCSAPHNLGVPSQTPRGAVLPECLA